MARVVVLGSEASVVEVLRELLESDGHEVIVGVPAHAGPDALRELGVAIVVADGFAAARHDIAFLRALKTADSRVRIVLLTGGDRRGGDIQALARSVDADHILTKPLDIPDFLRVVGEGPADR